MPPNRSNIPGPVVEATNLRDAARRIVVDSYAESMAGAPLYFDGRGRVYQGSRGDLIYQAGTYRTDNPELESILSTVSVTNLAPPSFSDILEAVATVRRQAAEDDLRSAISSAVSSTLIETAGRAAPEPLLGPAALRDIIEVCDAALKLSGTARELLFDRCDFERVKTSCQDLLKTCGPTIAPTVWDHLLED